MMTTCMAPVVIGAKGGIQDSYATVRWMQAHGHALNYEDNKHETTPDLPM